MPLVLYKTTKNDLRYEKCKKMTLKTNKNTFKLKMQNKMSIF